MDEAQPAEAVSTGVWTRNRAAGIPAKGVFTAPRFLRKLAFAIAFYCFGVFSSLRIEKQGGEVKQTEVKNWLRY